MLEAHLLLIAHGLAHLPRPPAPLRRMPAARPVPVRPVGSRRRPAELSHLRRAAGQEGETNRERRNTMRVFIAGASGAIGTRLVPQLVERGHEVVGTYHSPGKDEVLRTLGAEPVALDLLDREAVLAAVRAAAPDVIVHEATALAEPVVLAQLQPHVRRPRNRLGTEGTDALPGRRLGRGRAPGRRPKLRPTAMRAKGGPVKTEDDPLDSGSARVDAKGFAALRHLEDAVASRGRDRAPVRRVLRRPERRDARAGAERAGSRSSATAAG